MKNLWFEVKEYSTWKVVCSNARHRRVVYICLLQFRRRLGKVWETVDELRSYLRSRFIQLKSKSYEATCPEKPPKTFLKETVRHRFNHLCFATLPCLVLLKFFYFEKGEKKGRKWHLPRIQFIFHPFTEERNSLDLSITFLLNLKTISTHVLKPLHIALESSSKKKKKNELHTTRSCSSDTQFLNRNRKIVEFKWNQIQS